MKTKTYYEPFTGVTFVANDYDILETFYLINRMIASRGFAHLNDFFAYLDIPQEEVGESIGWNDWIDYVMKERPIEGSNRRYTELIFNRTPKTIREKRRS